MTDKPPVCLSCDGTKFEIKSFDFGVDLGEMYLTMKTDAWECQDCGTPLMNTEQMDTLRQLLSLTDSKGNTKHVRQ